MVLDLICIVCLSDCSLAQLSQTSSASFTATPLIQYHHRSSPPHQSLQSQITGTMCLLPLSHLLFTPLRTILFHTQSGARKPSRPRARLAWVMLENPWHSSYGQNIPVEKPHCTISTIRDSLSRKERVIKFPLVLSRHTRTQNQEKSMERARWNGKVG